MAGPSLIDTLKAIRDDMQDTAATPRWGDDILLLYVKDAIRDYSMWFPRRIDRIVPVAAGAGYTLPADFIDPILVECPRDTYLEQRMPRQGIRFPAHGGRPFFFFIESGTLYLDGAPQSGDEVLLTYSAVHAVPTGLDDTTWTLTVPVSDEELIRLYVRGKCHLQMRARQAALDRFKTRATAGADRQDNPLAPEVDNVMSDYYARIAQRTRGGIIMLSRQGRMK